MDHKYEELRNEDICIIGAGFSGLCAAVQILRKHGSRKFVIFDQNTDVGGTWFTNNYPGCGCDVPGHLYSFSFEPKTDWSSVYASQPEILTYMKSIARKYSLYKHIRFRRIVQQLIWVESHHHWKANVLNMDTNSLEEYIFRIVIVGTGQFHMANFPTEFTNFQGPLIHTSKWDHSINLRGKVVAIIGSGASAVQLIPKIVGKVHRLISYQRRPSWIIPRIQFRYSSFTKWLYANVPGFRRAYRSLIFLMNETNYLAFQRRTFLSKIGVAVGNILARSHLQLNLRNNPELRRDLKPEDDFGCTRPCLSNSYYRALASQNVKVVTSKISSVTADSIISEDGTINRIDVLILATGFQVQDYFSPMEIFGENGIHILQKWKEHGPVGYLGTFYTEIPNLFFLHGPGSDVGHNTSIFTFECQINMILKVVKEMERKKTNRVCLKSSSANDYMEQRQNKLRKTVWNSESCDTYFKNAQGTLTLPYPESLISFWWNCKTMDPSKIFHFG